MKTTSIQGSHRQRRVVSISTGNWIQITSIVLGWVLLWISARPMGVSVRIATMIAGYLLIYFNSHSWVHYSIGRLVGIQFKHYSIGGSSHAAAYPPVVRMIFNRLPFFAAHSDPASMRAAHPYAKALMFAAGITGTVVLCTGAAIYAYQANTPGGAALLVFNIIWSASSIIAELKSSGDLGKAFKFIKRK